METIGLRRRSDIGVYYKPSLNKMRRGGDREEISDWAGDNSSGNKKDWNDAISLPKIEDQTLSAPSGYRSKGRKEGGGNEATLRCELFSRGLVLRGGAPGRRGVKSCLSRRARLQEGKSPF